MTNKFSVGDTLDYLHESVFNLKGIVLWLVLNVTKISGVAWFLYALLYCYVFRYLFYNIFEKRIIYLVMLLGFAGGIVIKLIFHLIGIGFNGVNNVWFKGLPFFLYGKLLWGKRNFFAKMKHTSILVGTAIIGYLLISCGFLYNNGSGYIGMMFLSISLFILCMVYPSTVLTKGNNLNELICQMGSKYSFFIYIGHPLVMHVFDGVVNATGVLLWLRPIIVLGINVFLAVCFCRTKSKLTNRV